MQRTKPPFRADEVGSLLRPPKIKEARAKLEKGDIFNTQTAAEVAKELESGWDFCRLWPFIHVKSPNANGAGLAAGACSPLETVGPLGDASGDGGARLPHLQPVHASALPSVQERSRGAGWRVGVTRVLLSTPLTLTLSP